MSPKNYGMTKSIDELNKRIDAIIEAGKPFGFDIESGYTGPDREKGSVHIDDPDWILVGLSFTNSTDWARYVPVGHDDPTHNLDNRDAALAFWRLVNSGLGVAHNCKFELRGMRRWFLKHIPDVPGVLERNGYFPILSDTMIELYVEAMESKFGLKDATFAVFRHQQTELTELFPELKGKALKMLRFNTLPLTPEVVNYACEDALWCLEHHLRVFPEIKDKLIFKLEMQIIPILCEMEDYGVLFDWSEMRAKAEEAEIFKDSLRAEIMVELSQLLDEPTDINLASPAQLADVLFNRLGFKSVKTTDTGNPSTDAVALEALSQQYPIVRKIRDWKEISKLIGSYLRKYERDFSYAADGRTHPSHNQVVVAAGRFSVSEPGYQQLPKKYHYMLNEAVPLNDAHQKAHKKPGDDDCECDSPEYAAPPGTEFRLRFRGFVKAPKDHYILGWDFSQVELRVLAGVSREPTLLNAFANDEDVHVATAALMLGKPKAEVNKEDRAKGKTLNFGMVYQMGVKGLADRLGVTKERAQELTDEYFEALPSVRNWVNKIQASGRSNRYVETMFGRRVPIREFEANEKWIYAKGERLCVNAPIQGAAADYMKFAMIKAHKAIVRAGLDDRVHMVMNIHDAIEFYVHDSVDYQDVIRLLSPEVTFAVKGLPKIVADWHMGYDWQNLMEIKYENDAFKLKGEPTMERYSPDNQEAIATHTQAMVSVEPVPRPSIPALVLPEHAHVVLETRVLEVTITEMPDRAHFERWLGLLKSSKGLNKVLLITPGGNVEYDGLSLTPTDQPQISLALGGASAKWASDTEIDASAFDDIDL